MPAPRTIDRQPAREPKPITVPGAVAARMLCLSYDTVNALMRADVFTVVAPWGRGRGKRLFLHVDEIELFAETRCKDTVREFRTKKRRLGKAGAR